MAVAAPASARNPAGLMRSGAVFFLLLTAGCGTGGSGTAEQEAVRRQEASAATERPETRRNAAERSSAPVFTYTCDAFRFTVQMGDAQVRLFLPERIRTLPQVSAASGAKYASAGDTFWAKGKEALLKLDGTAYRGCVGEVVASPWESARLRRVDFRAVGQEPGWTLEIWHDETPLRLIYLANYGQDRYTFEAPERSRGEGRVTYRAQAGGHTLKVVLTNEPCRDVMSGEAFDWTVTLRFDGEAYRGCGRRLE